MTEDASGSPAPWATVQRRSVVRDRWITLWADECRTADGKRIAPYYVLEPADWISVLALNQSGDAIVVEEYRHGAGIVALGTVGGTVDSDEDPFEAARRELREETGFAASRMVDLGHTWANFGNHTNRVHHFLALDCTRSGEQQLDDTEEIAVHVLPLAGLGEQLAQSYHQLTWFKALGWMSDRA